MILGGFSDRTNLPTGASIHPTTQSNQKEVAGFA
jgi:hypothetical protein